MRAQQSGPIGDFRGVRWKFGQGENVCQDTAFKKVIKLKLIIWVGPNPIISYKKKLEHT